MDTAILTPERHNHASHTTKEKTRVLVVDDNVDTADSLAILLRFCDHDVRTAYTGPAALKIAETFCPNVVLSDIGLPGMNGYDLCRQLRSKFTSLRLIAMSGYGQLTDLQLSKEAGFELHLLKPVEPSQILKLLAEMTSAEQGRTLARSA